MSRVWPRSLLSLLMLWQLLASVLAHPLEVHPAGSSQPMGSVAQQGEDCAHMAMPVHHEMQNDVTSSIQAEPLFHGMEHPCHSICKCPCAGTPALAFVLPVISPVMPEHPGNVMPLQELLPPPLANLLRPPISNSAPA